MKRNSKVKPVLFIFSGLPGSGKTTLARMLSSEINAVYLRIDTVEQAIRDLCNYKIEAEGYRLSYRIASDNLLLGNSVIADSCNPLEITRNEWEDIAINSGASYINIEVICSDKTIHRKRVENRISNIRNLKLPTWSDVEKREFHRWGKNRIVIDTAFNTEKECFHKLYEMLCAEIIL